MDPNNGYPTWFSDGTVKLQFCYTAELGCLSTPPNAGAPASYPDNFPEEAFWFAAEASGGNLGLYEAALEGAHLNDAVVDGEQIGFARLRFRLEGLVPNASYTVTHPYGVTEGLVADAAGEIDQTFDEGMCAPTDTRACDWEGVGAAFLGDYQVNTATFLRQLNAPAGTLGNPAVAASVTGAPSGNNFVRVDGPNAGGPGVNTLTVNQFTIQGVISDAVDGAPGTPDLAAASDSGRSATDNITNVATPTFTVDVPDGTEVSLLVGTSATPAATGTSTGNGYSLALPAALADGRHEIRARIANPDFATDPAASEFLTSTPVGITVDTIAPTATLAAPMPSNPSLDRTPSFNFGSNEANSSYDCQLLPSSPAWETNCASGKTYDDQADAIYTFNVRAVDPAGNVGTPAAYGWGIGTVAGPAGTGVQKDMDGNGTPDYIGRTSDGKLWYYAGRSNGTLSPRLNIGNSGWNVMTSLLMPGDFNGDTRADLIASDNSGRLWLYAGAGNGRLSGRTLIGSSGWNSMSELVAPGDFNGDTNPDLLARDRAGKLWLYPSDGNGRFKARTVAGSSGWNAMTDLAGVGTFDAGSTTDMIARDSNGRLWLYKGTGTGGFSARSMIGSSGWNSMTSLVGPGAFNTGADHDVIARHNDGRLWLYPGNGTGLGSRIQIGHGFNIFTMIAQ
ncbi:FG-GAP-like repeat-containing protein [Arthrobacter sp. VKM Ac-2550]|uniref:FG-GAP-like repeat-containing protein n=1 Tax=Crystallibacter permensis TaxID=1938888 RepID=UPI00222697FB|nr:FG-GAP-like repeat-containing protein [Arthrobacter sp. VKM Ac-2550]